MSSQLTLSQLRIEITGGAEDPISIAIVPIDWRLEFPQEEYLHEVSLQLKKRSFIEIGDY